MANNVRLSGAQTAPRAEFDIRVSYVDTSQIIAASNSLGTDARQAQFYSSDSGASWNQTVLQLTGGDTFHSDPAVDWTSDGTAWAITIGISATAFVLRCYKSTDGGATWNFDLTPSGSQTNVDREIMWTDHSPTSPYKDQIYVIWHQGVPGFVARRTAGASGAWQAPVQISGAEQTGSAIGADIKTNSAGEVFAFYPDADGSGKLRLAKSTDGGATFQSPRLDGTGFVQIASLFATTRKLSIPSDRADIARGARVYMSGGAYLYGDERPGVSRVAGPFRRSWLHNGRWSRGQRRGHLQDPYLVHALDRWRSHLGRSADAEQPGILERPVIFAPVGR